MLGTYQNWGEGEKQDAFTKSFNKFIRIVQSSRSPLKSARWLCSHSTTAKAV